MSPLALAIVAISLTVLELVTGKGMCLVCAIHQRHITKVQRRTQECQKRTRRKSWLCDRLLALLQISVSLPEGSAFSILNGNFSRDLFTHISFPVVSLIVFLSATRVREAVWLSWWHTSYSHSLNTSSAAVPDTHIAES